MLYQLSYSRIFILFLLDDPQFGIRRTADYQLSCTRTRGENSTRLVPTSTARSPKPRKTVTYI